MKMHILSVHQGEFRDDDGKTISYSNAWVLPDEHKRDSDNKGRKPQKVGTAWDLINAIQPADLPGIFEVEFSIGSGGKMILVAATSTKAPIKAA
jgi:hypothetical protein